MHTIDLAYASYWRNSLADAELGRGAFQTVHQCKGLLERPLNEFIRGIVSADLVAQFFNGISDATESIDVILRPSVFARRREHSQLRNGAPSLVSTITSKATLDRTGKLFPQFATIPRDLLEPLDHGSFSLGSVSALDSYVSANPLPSLHHDLVSTEDKDQWFASQWQAFRAYCKTLCSEVLGQWPTATDDFCQTNYWLIAKSDSLSGACANILNLYDHARDSRPSVPLFERYASVVISEPSDCFAPNTAFSARLGHSGDAFPLADAQRDALTHLLGGSHGDILGVNGPPGTGKTTLLLSVVATLWAKAALKGGEPPVIIAASTNNQAVTNILDAFGKDFSTGSGPFAGRWLPGVKSFGAYFPSASKESEASEKYQTRSFFDGVEATEYVLQAEEAFLSAASLAYPTRQARLDSIVDALQSSIRDEFEKLAAIEGAWSAYQHAKQTLSNELGDSPIQTLAMRKQNLEEAERGVEAFEAIRTSWEDFLDRESLFCWLFSWISAVEIERVRRAVTFLTGVWAGPLPSTSWTSVEALEQFIANFPAQLSKSVKGLESSVDRGERAISDLAKSEEAWISAIKPLALGGDPKALSLADCDVAADTRIRFNVFLLSTHYWEGRWLQMMKASLIEILDQKTKTGRAAVEARWRRRMMLTPCVVSTFHMLPKLMLAKRYNREKGTFLDTYLYDFVDLLIVDEAGQVLPEVAGASFLLAKQALVIGDSHQIEPIWSISTPVDVGNLRSCGLLPEANYTDSYDQLTALGKTAAAGSVMRIAQGASRYHYAPRLDRGMYLLEHRRCHDEIVSYCNLLCYNNQLLPMRGRSSTDSEPPALGYLHIHGMCEQSNSGSRRNLLEAETIAAWLVENKDALEDKYGTQLDQIVGVVTPFSGQVAAIAAACKAQDIGESMTIGTVHSLQGAERSVVIFSPVYSKHADGGFIDQSKSMLNVAVSRAKDSFLVFGDMDVMTTAPPSSPRGLLASLLSRDQRNSIAFDHLPRQDFNGTEKGIRYLSDAAEHNTFLCDNLDRAKKNVLIVSPWIRHKQMEESGVLTAMTNAVKRGIDIKVYCDKALSTEGADTKTAQWQVIAETFMSLGVQFFDVSRLHSKIVSRDEEMLCIGSFNWLSAARSGKYARHETSIVYSGSGIAAELDCIRLSLEKRCFTH